MRTLKKIQSFSPKLQKKDLEFQQTNAESDYHFIGSYTHFLFSSLDKGLVRKWKNKKD